PKSRHHSCVVTCSAGENVDAADPSEHLSAIRSEQLRPDAADALQGVGDGLRLLEDLLLHEVAIGAEFDDAAGSLHADDGARYGRTAGVINGVSLAGDIRKIAFLHVHHALRHR